MAIYEYDVLDNGEIVFSGFVKPDYANSFIKACKEQDFAHNDFVHNYSVEKVNITKNVELKNELCLSAIAIKHLRKQLDNANLCIAELEARIKTAQYEGADI